MGIKITNYALGDNGVVSETENISNIIDKMIRIAAKITCRFASDIVYDINDLNKAVEEGKPLDRLLFFRENGVTTTEVKWFDESKYNSLFNCFTPIQIWRLTHSPSMMETRLVRVSVSKERNL